MKLGFLAYTAEEAVVTEPYWSISIQDYKMTETDISIVGEGGGSNSEHMRINIHKRELGEFLSGLLGKPRNTKKIFNSDFYIDLNFLYNLDQIIHQRIMTQQKSVLTDFTAKVYFSDDRIQTINSREEFISYRQKKLFLLIFIGLT